MKLVIVDANVLIYLAEIKKINSLFNSYTIYLPRAIFDEVKYFIDKDTGERISINLSLYQKNKRLRILESLDIEEAGKLKERIGQYGIELHPGELEAIYYVLKDEFTFCSADGAAIKSLAILGVESKGISLEKLMGGKFRKMRQEYTERFFKSMIKAGKLLKIQGFNH